MGYFSNGSEGMLYEEQYCDRCEHQDGCAVWMAHNIYNYDECNNPKSILHLLIPRSADKLDNEQCRMFIEKRAMRDLFDHDETSRDQT